MDEFNEKEFEELVYISFSTRKRGKKIDANACSGAEWCESQGHFTWNK